MATSGGACGLREDAGGITPDMSTYLPPDMAAGAAQGCFICTPTVRVWVAQGKNSVNAVNVGQGCRGYEYSSVVSSCYSAFEK